MKPSHLLHNTYCRLVHANKHTAVPVLSHPFTMFSNNRKRNTSSGKQDVPMIRNRNAYYVMPAEEEPHEGTWLQWPHNQGWDLSHVERYEPSWIAMTQALHKGEIVHIIVENDEEHARVRDLLEHQHQLDITQLDFHVFSTDDVWVRDNGPIFVFADNSNNNKHSKEQLSIANFLFNGWGGKADDYYDNYIPIKIGHALSLPVVDIPMVHEGGSVEVDGRGTMMAKRSSILNVNRNPGWTQSDAETYFTQYLGVRNFIWLNGEKGGDITDDHIDGTARFANGDTIVTMYKEDFLNKKEYTILQNAQDVDGKAYKIVHLPCTKHKVKTAKDYGIYINFYVGNKVVLVPSFGDPNDKVAAEKLQRLYPTREVVSIPFGEVYCDGGLIHCVTQQQPKIR